MSYVVLARKYRPLNFSEMAGQDHVVRALTNALTTQRLHHAYLFTGTRGVGKTTVSRILAKSLNCQGPDGQGSITATPCGVCPACTEIDAGRFVDYTELDAASNRGVEEVQALLEQAVYKPVQGRFKVFMIDEVHMLTGHAFNAMLKTLEEPPEYLKFVLATTDPQKVPVTVLSRCLQFNLRPMAPETVQEHLGRVLEREHVRADAQALRLLARAARGSMRDALSLTDQAIAFGSGELQEATVRQMLGSVDRTFVFRLIDALARADGRAVVEIADALRIHGLNAASTLEEMTTVLQRMAVLQVAPDTGAGESDSEALETARLAALLPADETQLLYSLCLHGRSELGLAPDEYAALTMVLLRLLAFKPTAGPMEKKSLRQTPDAPPSDTPGRVPMAPRLADQVQSVQECAKMELERSEAVSDPGKVAQSRTMVLPVRIQEAPGARAEPRAVHQEFNHQEVVDGASAGGDLEGDFWHATVSALIAVESIAALPRELALQSQLVMREGAKWLLRVERESLNQALARERLQEALQHAGHEVQLHVETGRVTDSPARRNAAAVARRQRAAEAVFLSDPFVQAMMQDFGAKIVPGSIKPQ